MGEIMQLGMKVPDSEKITINLGFVDLGHIDLLVRGGFYSSRSDFIRTAIRNQLSAQADQSRNIITRQTLELGLKRYTRADLESVVASGGKLEIKVLGLLTFDADVTPTLASSAIKSIILLGALHAEKDLKTALAPLIT